MATGLPVVSTVLRSGLAKVFGAAPFDPRADPGDPGIFGAEAVSWRVIAEPAAIVGGVRALLVQLLHPHAMAGVHDHSAFRDDPLGRLHRTSAYVTATTFGSTREALAIARRVRGAHVVVRGTAPDGTPYAASEPRLLAWVSMALTSSFLSCHATYAPHPLTLEEADAFVDEQARAAALLDPGVDLAALAADTDALAALRAGTLPLPLLVEGVLPRTAAELAAHLDALRPELGLNEQGREALRFLRWPRLPPAVRAGYLPLFAGAVADLEPWQRALLGLPGSRALAAAGRLQTRGLLGAFRLTTGISPAYQAALSRANALPTRA
jgi:uncharacterized protein (DUF2236 family)